MNSWQRVVAASWIAVLLCATPLTSSAQAAATGGVPTVSRLVMLFTEQENQLAARIRARDAEGSGKLLTDDFEVRTGSAPGRPIPRADWLRESMQSPGPPVTPTQMAVHDLGGTAVVSFLQGYADSAGLFVVDVWRRSGEEWKLAIRYATPATPGAPIAGVPPAEPKIPKKY